MKTLRPMIYREAYYLDMERVINDIFEKLIYAPLRAVLRDNSVEIQNSASPLADAISSGRVQYYAGRLTGSFDSKISKELRTLGAKYDARSKSWLLATPPAAVQIAIAQADARVSNAIRQTIKVLDGINVPKVISASGIPEKYIKPIGKMNDDFLRLTRSVAIAPKMTDRAKKIIAEQWGENLELYIKSWAEEEILTLRQKVTDNVMHGQRAQNLVKTIQESYGSSKKKAKFLARQETSLLMSKMREERYKDIGVSKYRWSTSNDEKVRKTHAVLDNKVFFWDSPPVVDLKGRRANPGEDFNCRCIAIPIMETE